MKILSKAGKDGRKVLSRPWAFQRGLLGFWVASRAPYMNIFCAIYNTLAAQTARGCKRTYSIKYVCYKDDSSVKF